TAATFEQNLPFPATRGAHAGGAGAHDCSLLRCIDGIENDEARIVDKAIRINEGASLAVLERGTQRTPLQRNGLRGRKNFSAAKVIINEQAKAEHPLRSASCLRGQDEAHRADKVRR